MIHLSADFIWSRFISHNTHVSDSYFNIWIVVSGIKKIKIDSKLFLCCVGYFACKE